MVEIQEEPSPGEKGDARTPRIGYPLRWRMLTVWIVAYTLAGIWAYNEITNIQDDIQQQRYDTIIADCEEINSRHDRTVTAMNAQMQAEISRNPGQANEIKASHAFTTLLINDLVPKRNCVEVANEQVNPPEGEK